jgi:thioredoxin reductase (NADPH)
VGGLQQIVTAIGEGSVAAMSAFEDISHPYWKEVSASINRGDGDRS